jgi:hypothetical protein
VCNHCERKIATNTPWVCGFCQKKNERIDEFPFVHRCEHCGAEPKAYKCHHSDCRKLIFLSEDQQEINYAKCVNIPAASKPRRVEKDRHVEALAESRKAIERKALEAQEAKLDVELKALRQSLETPKMKSIEEQYRGALKNEDDERRLRAAIDKEFKDDGDELKRRHLVVDKIMRETPY